MASNLQLTELEQRVLDYVKQPHPRPLMEQDIINYIFPRSNGQYFSGEIRQAIASLLSNSYVSADENLRYVAIGGEL